MSGDIVLCRNDCPSDDPIGFTHTGFLGTKIDGDVFKSRYRFAEFQRFQRERQRVFIDLCFAFGGIGVDRWNVKVEFFVSERMLEIERCDIRRKIPLREFRI